MLGLAWFYRKLTGRVAGTDKFVQKCEAAFHEVDHDGSGTLDSTELHLVVMLVYDRLNAAHRTGGHVYPPTRKEILDSFMKCGHNCDDALTLDAFLEFMDVLCKDASDGMVLNFAKTFAFVPAIAAGLARGTKKFAKNVDTEMSKHKGLAPALYAGVAGYIVSKLPAPIGDGERRY
jgi:hypothetical protein